VPFPAPDSPFLIEKYKYRRWAVKEKATDTLIVVTAYKKGAKEVVRLLDELVSLRRKFEGLRLIEDLVEPVTAARRR
jgi:hypothetical protein